MKSILYVYLSVYPPKFLNSSNKKFMYWMVTIFLLQKFIFRVILSWKWHWIIKLYERMFVESAPAYHNLNKHSPVSKWRWILHTKKTHLPVRFQNNLFRHSNYSLFTNWRLIQYNLITVHLQNSEIIQYRIDWNITAKSTNRLFTMLLNINKLHGH